MASRMLAFTTTIRLEGVALVAEHSAGQQHSPAEDQVAIDEEHAALVPVPAGSFTLSRDALGVAR
jgi:hypothetical protein